MPGFASPARAALCSDRAARNLFGKADVSPANRSPPRRPGKSRSPVTPLPPMGRSHVIAWASLLPRLHWQSGSGRLRKVLGTWKRLGAGRPGGTGRIVPSETYGCRLATTTVVRWPQRGHADSRQRGERAHGAPCRIAAVRACVRPRRAAAHAGGIARPAARSSPCYGRRAEGTGGRRAHVATPLLRVALPVEALQAAAQRMTGTEREWWQRTAATTTTRPRQVEICASLLSRYGAVQEEILRIVSALGREGAWRGPSRPARFPFVGAWLAARLNRTSDGLGWADGWRGAREPPISRSGVCSTRQCEATG